MELPTNFGVMRRDGDIVFQPMQNGEYSYSSPECQNERPDPSDKGFLIRGMKEEVPRSPGQLDRDRILYSGHFLRLAEVTQTVSPVHGYVFHNRLSHSLKVAQVSRRLCERLQKRYKDDVHLKSVVEMLDPDVCEAVGLAHDLGHPPFGHATERQLQDKLASEEGVEPEWALEDAFEGNAQSFRIVCCLAGTHLPIDDRPEFDVLGLNLTRRTLNGILKYPWPRAADGFKSKKWGVYKNGDDMRYFDFARLGMKQQVRHEPTLEAQIMDWADDITFAVHDLLDFYASGDIPIYFFLPEFKGDSGTQYMDERLKFIQDILNNVDNGKFLRDAENGYGSTGNVCLNAILDDIIEGHLHRLSSRYTATNKQRGSISAIAFGMIEQCIRAFKLVVADDIGLGPWRVEIEPKAKAQVWLLKQFTWHYIIRGQQLQYERIGQQRAAKTVFETFMGAAKDESDKERQYLFPWHMRDEVSRVPQTTDEKKKKTRCIVDYLSSMSEPELMRIYRQLVAENGYR